MAMRFLLVGMHFHPPSKLLLESYLAGGTEVTLVAEPDNPYDAGAVRVEVPKGDLAVCEDHLDRALEGFGMSLASLPESIMLGHLAASGGKPLAKAQKVSPGVRGNAEVAGATSGRLLFGGNGQVLVEVAEGDDVA